LRNPEVLRRGFKGAGVETQLIAQAGVIYNQITVLTEDELGIQPACPWQP